MLRRVPVIALMLGLMALMMLVPALQAATENEWRSARGFLYPALFGLLVSAAIAVLLRPISRHESAEHELLTLLLLWLALPAYAAFPLVLLTPALGWNGAWFEMVAALTTTGGSAYSKAGLVPDAVHLWRGMVGWLGGLLTLMAAYVVLAPRRLGGFEVVAAAEGIRGDRPIDLRMVNASFESRVQRALRTILPVYLLMTFALGVIFNTADKAGLIAAVHAMSVISTSGISPVEGGFAASGSLAAEVAAAIFMVLAVSRFLYAGASQRSRRQDWRQDPELRLMAGLVLGATVLLFLRHWVGVLTIDVDVEALDGAEALWGAAFTTLSFLTTTGFESHAWASARDWSGLANPGLVLLALCLVGGGAATTAGGIKLIRVYALMRHGVRELERIAMPNSVSGNRGGQRGLRREGAFIAWAFMMLFLLALFATVLALTLTGMEFDDAFVAAIAALTNTGPAYATIAGEGKSFALFDAAQRSILCATMILGRIETLAVIALFNPERWRDSSARSKKTGKSRAEPPLSEW